MYEFDDEKAEQIWLFGNKIAILSLVLAFGSILGIISSIISLSNESNFHGVVMLIEFLFLLVIAFFLFRPSDNFKAIAESEGTDIEELIVGMKDFNLAFAIIAGLISLIGILQFLLIIAKV